MFLVIWEDGSVSAYKTVSEALKESCDFENGTSFLLDISNPEAPMLFNTINEDGSEDWEVLEVLES